MGDDPFAGEAAPRQRDAAREQERAVGSVTNTRPGFLFLACPDSRLLQEKVTQLAVEHPPSHGAWERRVFWAEEGLPDAFWEILTLRTLTGESRLVVLRGAHALLTAQWQALSAALARPNDQAWPLLCLENAWKKGAYSPPAALVKQQCWKLAQTREWIWRSEGLTRKRMPALLERETAVRSVQLTTEAKALLAEHLPLDAAAVHSELDKLAMAAHARAAALRASHTQAAPAIPGERDACDSPHAHTPSPACADHAGEAVIDAPLARETAYTPELDVFAILRAVQTHAKGGGEGRGSGVDLWRRLVGEQAQAGELLFPFLASLAREGRILWQLASGERVTGYVPHGILREKETLARELGYVRLAGIFDLAMEADRGVKYGERSPEQAMERLMAGLVALFREGGAGSTSGARSGHRPQPRPHPHAARGRR